MNFIQLENQGHVLALAIAHSWGNTLNIYIYAPTYNS